MADKFNLDVKRNDPEFISAVISFICEETGMSPDAAAELYAAWLNWAASNAGRKPQREVWSSEPDMS